jgi:hypothetical protein
LAQRPERETHAHYQTTRTRDARLCCRRRVLLHDALELAEEFYDLNNDAAESAPQQQVVNGWYVNDLLNIIALETGRTATQSSDDRTAALLAIGVVAIALWGVTAPPAGQASALQVPLPEPETNKANPAADFQSSSTSQDTN